jgi:hypothetical protein
MVLFYLWNIQLLKMTLFLKKLLLELSGLLKTY